MERLPVGTLALFVLLLFCLTPSSPVQADESRADESRADDSQADGSQADGSGDASEPTYAGRPASWWLGELCHEDRAAAAYVAFRQIGPSALPVLAQALELAEDRETRRRLLHALHAMRCDLTPVLPQLLDVLAGDDGRQRRQALDLLTAMGEKAFPALPQLLERLEPGAPMSVALMRVMARMGDKAGIAEERLLEVLATGTSAERRQAVSTLSQVVPNSQTTLDALGVAFDTEDAKVREAIARSLSRFSPSLSGVAGLLRSARADPDTRVRTEAVSSLVALVPTDIDVSRELLLSLVDSDPWIVRHAAAGLQKIQPPVTEAVPILIPLLEGKERRVHGAVVRLLGTMGEAALPAMPALVRALDRPVAAEAQRALRQLIPHSLPALLEVLARGRPQPRALAYGALARVPNEWLFPNARPLAAALADFVEDGRVQVNQRYDALGLLARLVPASPDALVVLLRQGGNADPGLRHNAAIAVARIPEARGALLEMLGSSNEGERTLAWHALSMLPRGPDILPALLPLLRHELPGIRQRAVGHVLGRARFQVGPSDEDDLTESQKADLVRVLVEQLEDADARQRATALRALGALGASALAAQPALLEVLAKAEAQDAMQIAYALRRLAPHGDADGLAGLVESQRGRLEDEDPHVVVGAVLALTALRPGAAPDDLVPVVRELLRREDEGLLSKVVGAIQMHGHAMRPVVGDLVALIRRRPGRVTPEAASALGRIGANDDMAFECLVDLLHDRDEPWPWRGAAAGALHPFGERGAGALVAALDDPDPRVLETVVRALGRLGKGAVGARPALEALRAHADERVRAAVALALRRVP